MIRSMTGFGEAERDQPVGRYRVEIKTVNHRHFNSSLRTPFGFDRIEGDIQKWLRGRISRGHVSYGLFFEPIGEAVDEAVAVELEVERARGYRAALHELREKLEIPGEVDLAMMARFGDVFRRPEVKRQAPEVDAEFLEKLTAEAAEALVAMREAEGVRLQADLEQRLVAMAGELDRVEARAPERLLRERERLRQAVRELSEGVNVDEDRLAREIAYIADKWDINEELVRFRSHLELFQESLDEGGGPVGKRLSFLAQEMLREANTIGSKANDAEIAQASIALKEEIERLREQVENVE